jgi:hypothetical protein
MYSMCSMGPDLSDDDGTNPDNMGPDPIDDDDPGTDD